MDTTTATRTAHAADFGDEFVAGMPFPVRDFRVRLTPASARALFRARHAFWLAVAESHEALVAKGCTDAAHDAAEARTFAEVYAPRG